MPPAYASSASHSFALAKSDLTPLTTSGFLEPLVNASIRGASVTWSGLSYRNKAQGRVRVRVRQSGNQTTLGQRKRNEGRQAGRQAGRIGVGVCVYVRVLPRTCMSHASALTARSRTL
jgi:hypothetical protein